MTRAHVTRPTALAVLTSIAAFIALASVAAAQGPPATPGTKAGTAAGVTVGGISCDAMEGMRVHIHQHLVIFDHGKQVEIPNDVGRPASGKCLYWLHTHTPDGILHIEAPLDRSFTLGDFFKVWAEPMTASRVSSAKAKKGEAIKVWVNGAPFTKDPASIKLDAHADIVIMVGPPYVTPPKFTQWGSL